MVNYDETSQSKNSHTPNETGQHTTHTRTNANTHAHTTLTTRLIIISLT